MSETSDRFEPFLALADDLNYFPVDYYTPRRTAFLGRIGFLALLAFVVFLPTLTGPMIWFDVTSVRKNLLLRSLSGLGRIWGHPAALPTYQPIANTLLFIEFHIWRLYAGGYHLISLLMHITSGVLLWLILRRLSVPGAWLIAGVFLLHPVQTQSVAWIAAQESVLAGVFCLGAMLAYLRFARVHPEPPEHYSAWFISQNDGTFAPDPDGAMPAERRGIWYTLALLLFVAALLTHPFFATFPLLLVIVLWGHRGRLYRPAWTPILPFMVLSAFWIIFQVWLTHGNRASGMGGSQVLESIRLGPRVLISTTVGLLAPYRLAIVHPRWSRTDFSGMEWLFAAVLAAMILITWVLRSRISRSILAGGMFYFVSLLAAFALFRSEWLRYSFTPVYSGYLASAGLIACVVGAVIGQLSAGSRDGHLPDRLRWSRLGIGGVLIVGLSCLSWQSASTYSDEKRLWQSALMQDPDSPIAHLSLGNILLAESDPSAAAEEFNQAIASDPQNISAINGLGRAFEEQGLLDHAIEQFQKLAAVQPNEAEHQSNLAGIFAQQGDSTAALKAYEHAAALNPNDELIHSNIGLILADKGQVDRAIAEFKTALRMNPDSLPVHINLANVLFRQGRLDEAAEQLQQVMRIDPNNFEAYMNAGAMLGQLKQFDKAERMYRAAVQVRPTSAEAYNYLGITLAAQGHLSEANYTFGKAVELKPDFVEARQHLSLTEEQLKSKSGSPGK